MVNSATDWDPELDDGLLEEDRITRLLRWIGVFLIVPGISIGMAFVLFDDSGEHKGHIAISMSFGILGIFVALLARRIAVKYT